MTDADEREAILHALDVLTGLMACYAAMDQRTRLYGEHERRDDRTAPMAADWCVPKDVAA